MFELTSNVEADLIPNGGFESGFWPEKTDGWVVDTAVFYTGTASVKATGDLVNRRYMATSALNINRTAAYQLSVRIKMNSVSNSSAVSMSVMEMDGNHQSIGYLHSQTKLFSTGGTQDWTKYTITVENFNANTASIKVFVRLDAGVSGTVWFDDVKLKPGTASTNNMIQNGSFESGFWPERTEGFVMDQAVSHEADTSIRTTGDPTARRYMATSTININAAGAYLLSVWIKMDSVTSLQGVSLSVLEIDNNNQAIGYLHSQLKLLSTGGTQDWTKYTLPVEKFTVNTASIKIYVRLDAGTSGTVWFDDVELIPGSMNTNNLIPNGSFEGGFWPERTDGYFMDQVVSHDNVTSMRTTGDLESRRYMASGSISIDTANAYQLSVWIKTHAVSNTSAVGLSVLEMDANNQSIGYLHSQPKIISTGGTQDWTQYHAEVKNFAQGTAAIRIYVRLDAGVTGTVWFDDVNLQPLPLSVTQTQLGNVFVDPVPVAFHVRTTGDTINWEVKDNLENRILQGTQSVQNGIADLNFPVSSFGYFQLRVTTTANNVVVGEYVTPFARLSAVPAVLNATPFGVNTHLKNTSLGWNPILVDLVKKAGATQVRDEITWLAVETSKGQYNAPAYSEVYMSQLMQSGIKPFIVMDYTNPFYDNNSTVYTDEGRQGFADYGNFLVQHYSNQLKAVEIYNEYNAHFGDRGDGPADSRPDYYYQMLRKSYETIKAAHPDVTIVGLASANLPFDWIEEVFQLGSLQYMDVVSIHPYYYPAEPELLGPDLEQLQNLIKTYNGGQAKPIWITEFGWATHLSLQGVSEKTQAEYIVRYYVTAIAAGIEKIFIYDFMNDGAEKTNRENNFGIIRYVGDDLGPYTPKPAYASYAAMTRQLANAQFVQKESAIGSLYCYLFNQVSGQLRVMWSKELINVSISVTNPIVMTDMMGNSTTYEPYNGQVILSISGEPIYVEGNIANVSISTVVSMQADLSVVSGEDITVELTAVNTTTSPINFYFDIQGTSYEVSTSAGASASKSILIPSGSAIDSTRIVSNVRINNSLVGRLFADVHVFKAFNVKIKPNILNAASKSEQMILEVRNNSTKNEIVTQSIDWKIGNQTGISNQILTILPSAEQTIVVDLPVFELWVSYPYKVTVNVENRNSQPQVGTIGFNPLMQKTVDQVAGLPDMTGLPFIDIFANGTLQMLVALPYNGVSDLSGIVWINWDRNNLYVTAKITDDTHAYVSVNDLIWNNDGIQIAVASGMPGDTELYDEFGISMTSEGPRIYRFHSSPDVPNGPIENAQLQVTRDEQVHQTIYQLALPWDELHTVDPNVSNLFSLSFLVNDNDGTIRKGFIEWGSGIGKFKDPVQYRPVQLMKTDFTVPTTTVSTQPAQADGQNGWFVQPVTLHLSATDDLSGVAESGYSLNRGVDWQTYVGPVTLGQDGHYTFSYRSTDLANNTEEMKTITINKDSTAPVTVANVSPPQPNGANGWYRSNVAITFTASDSLSGVDQIQYLNNNSVNWTVYSGPLNYTQDGTYTVKYCSKDLSGNVEIAKTHTLRIDKTPPTITFSVSDGISYWIDETVVITSQANDSGSGIATFTHTNISAPAYTFVIGTNTLTASATDIAGNTATSTIHFKVKISLESLIRLIKKLLAGNQIESAFCIILLNLLLVEGRVLESKLDVFKSKVTAQRGKVLSAEQADLLVQLADKLKEKGTS
ncbi:sugar-binding protein [Paenibacillus sp. SI8]|uniref:OmpL47-type beta-barrel domain-containing protein n=1 Tax=unclassified Paenibacillus TaxID=185978 RepID=UPI003466E0CA